MLIEDRRPRIGLLLGDPSGIGPEVTAKLLALPDTREQAQVLVIGNRDVYSRGLQIAAIPDPRPEFLEYAPDAPEFSLAAVSRAAGEYTLGSLRFAMEAVRRGDIGALVYAPLNKQAMKLAGMAEEDELHYFAALLGHSGPVSEINVCGGLWTSRVTSHVPLNAVAGLVSVERIQQATHLLHDALAAGGVESPKIAIAALNPHAGEGGLLGTEEITIIGPAVERLRASGLDVRGPLPADTLFIAARRGDYNGVVTMYHDQGQIALKLLGFDRGVTVAGGLPVAITTPAHGTAFDIAGKGVADPSPLREAFAIACAMARRTAHKLNRSANR